MNSTSSKINKEKSDKLNNLFERTADEIFFDFLAKHKKKIIGIIISSLIIVVYATYYWHQDHQHNLIISEEISHILQKKEKGEEYHQDIQNCLQKTKKVDHQATLLLLEDVDKMTEIEWQNFLLQVKNIKYYCQYVHTASHFKRFSYTSELLFLKTLYFLGKRKNLKEITNFFMEKKLHTSIFSNYMQYILVIYTQDNDMLNDMLSSYQYSITNLPEYLLYYIKTGVINE